MFAVVSVIFSAALLSSPPVSLSGAARDRAFPVGETERAAVINKSGLETRKSGDGKAAARAYAAALQVDPSYSPARFNLACELSRYGEVTEALKQLAELVRQGTPSSLKYVAAARFDEDFKAVWNDQRFREIQSVFGFDPSLPTLSQLCRSPPKALALLDDSLGVVVHIDDRDTMSKKVLTTGIKRGREARAAVYKLLEDMGFCENGVVGGDGELAIVDFPLIRESAKGLACYDKPSFGEWDQEHSLCIGVRKGKWTLVLAADYDGLAAVEDGSSLQQKRDKALKSAALTAFELLKK